jgi:recombination protein RecR
VLHLRNSKEQTVLAQALVNMREDIKYCTNCHNISDSTICEICANKIETTKLYVVEDIRDVMAIENTGQYRGVSRFRW